MTLLYDPVYLRCTGYLSLGQLIAALQCIPSGMAAKPSPEERDLQAEIDVRKHLTPFRKYASDLRSQVRLGARARHTCMRLQD